MTDVINVGKNAMDVTKSDIHIPYTKVIVVCGEEETEEGTVIKQYEAGDDTGLTLEVQCPWGTQAMANNLLTVIQNNRYKPYSVTSALLDPAAEIGDAVSTNNVYGGLFKQDATFGHGFYSDYSAPEDEQMNHEYKYETETERIVKRETNETKALFRATTASINAEVSRKVPREGGSVAENNFGWKLLDNSFTLYANNKPVFICTKDGLNVNGNGTFTGQITATSGRIGNNNNAWEIGAKSIYNGRKTFDGYEEGTYIGTDGISIYKDFKTNFSVKRSTGRLTVMSGMTSVDDSFNSNGMYLGYDGIALGGGRFKVNPAGELYAKAATISGNISAKSGTIGSDDNAWNIGSRSIYNGTNSTSSDAQGTYLGIDGIRIYHSSTENFTFTKNGVLSIMKGMTGIDDEANTNGFYFGNDGLVFGGGKLKLKRDGTLIAKKGTIGSDTNAWNIGARSIYNGTSSISSTDQGTYVGIDGIRVYNTATENFTFNRNGNITIMKGMTGIDDTSNLSGFYFGNDGLVFGGGKLKLQRDGTFTAKSGEIAGWSIGTSALSKTVMSGSAVQSHVGMSSSGTYAFYAGQDQDPTDCAFKVSKQGQVWLTKLFCRTVDTTAPGYDENDPSTWTWIDSQVDLGTNAFKISSGYNTIKSYNSSTGKVTMSNGVSFRTAASMKLKSSGWSGGKFSATMYYMNGTREVEVSSVESKKVCVRFASSSSGFDIKAQYEEDEDHHYDISGAENLNDLEFGFVKSDGKKATTYTKDTKVTIVDSSGNRYHSSITLFSLTNYWNAAKNNAYPNSISLRQVTPYGGSGKMVMYYPDGTTAAMSGVAGYWYYSPSENVGNTSSYKSFHYSN